LYRAAIVTAETDPMAARGDVVGRQRCRRPIRVPDFRGPLNLVKVRPYSDWITRRAQEDLALWCERLRTGHGPTAVAGPAAWIADCGYTVCVCDPVPSIAATTAPVTVVIAIVTRCFMVADNRVCSATVDLLGKPNLITLAPNSAVVGDAVANHEAGPVRSRPQCGASYRCGGGGVAEMVGNVLQPIANIICSRPSTPGRAAGPTANRPTAQLTPIAPDRDAEQRHDIAMFTSSCGPPRPQGVFSCG